MPSLTNAAADDSEQTSTAFKRRFLTRLIVVLIGGQFLDGYILGIVGTVTDQIKTDLALSTLMLGLIAAAPLFGIFIGSPIGGWAADRFGRKPMFLVDMGLFVVASSLQFVVATGNGPFDAAIELFAIRLVMGIAIGGEYSIGWPLLAEFSPPKLRGKLLGGQVVAWYAGFMVAFAIGHFLTHSTNVDWRVILGSSTFLAVLLFLGRIGLPESPRWLMDKGRRDEAMRIAHRYMNASDAADVAYEGDRQVLNTGSFFQLFDKQNWRATLFTSGYWFCAITPYFAIATFADSVLKKFGLGEGLANGVGLSALACAGVALTVFLLGKVRRRLLIVPTQWLCGVIMVIISAWAGAPAPVVLVLFLAFSFFNSGYNTLTAVYPGELFPTEIRGIGTGFATAMSRIGAGLGTFLLPWSIANLGAATTMMFAAILAFAGAALSQWLAPDNEGQSLSETAASYSH